MTSVSFLVLALHPAWIVGGVVVFFAGIVVLMIGAERKRKRVLNEKLTAMGMRVDMDPTEESKAGAFEHVRGMGDRLRTGAAGVRWHACGMLSGRHMLVLEHSYTTGSGKNRSTHYHTLVSVRCPGVWGQVTLTREHVFTKLGKAFGLKDLDLENPAFNNAWRVQCQDENFALALLSPRVQEYLSDPARKPEGESWHVGGGCACVFITSAAPGADRIGRLVERLDGFLRSLDPVLLDQLDRLDSGA